MPSRALREVQTPARARWPYLGRPQVMLGVAALVTAVASFLPWLDTALLGAVWGSTAGGLITFYAALLALPGVFWRTPRVVLAHALLLAVTALAVPGWRLVWALRQLPGLGTAWLPAPGMLLVLISGGVAAYVAARLLPAASGTAPQRDKETAPV